MSSVKAPRTLYALGALQIVGIALASVLTQIFYEERSGLASFKSLCSVNATWDCNLVAASVDAELVAGLPLSSFAAGWFILGLVLVFAALNRFWRREAVRALLLQSSVGLLATLYYLGIMVIKLKTYCLYCLGMDAVNIASFAIVLMLKPEGIRQMKPEKPKWRFFAIAGLLSMGISVFGLRAMDRAALSTSEIQMRANSILSQSPVAVRSGPQYASIGPENAPVTVVEFADFQCPSCRMGAFVVHALQRAMPNDVRLVFRHFPLDPACNPEMKRSLHPVACQAAAMSWCAFKQGKFAAVYEDLFENQQSLIPGPALVDRGIALGMEKASLETCMKSSEAMVALRDDIDEAVRLGIQYTPTLFINGYKIEGAQPAPILKAIAQELISRRKKTTPTGYAAK